MRCRNPYLQGNAAFPCGSCMPCRINRRRTWTFRILLEAMQHSQNSFVTLTYSEKCVPTDGSLMPKHLQDWLKRFRKEISPLKLRYFAVGEYGTQSSRPHYHAALFGFPACEFGQTILKDREKKCCRWCDVVKKTWAYGNSDLGQLNEKSSQYISGYVTKKMTSSLEPWLNGRHPEFARMSLKPGIGADAMDDVASEMMRYRLEEKGDVPSTLRSGRRLFPIGRYLRRRLRERVGLDVEAPRDLEKEKEVLALLEVARADNENPSLKYHLVKAGDQAVLNMQARERIFKKRDVL